MAAQRAAGEAFAGTLNEQLMPSALWTALPPAANAALVALMQNTNSVAAAISIVNLMAGPPKIVVTSPALKM
jgi:ABC-type arginine/histidine transport system permease subunit